MARRRRSGGLGRVDEAASRKSGADWVKLEDGDVVDIRVVGVDEDFFDGYVHRVQMEKRDGDSFYTDVMCLDQDEEGIPCPGCKEGLRRSYKFWTHAIIRGDEDDDDPAKRKDRIAIWSGGIKIAKQLNKLHAKHSLADRDVEVERTGSGKNDTSYDVTWAQDEDVELTKADKLLIEKSPDIGRYTRVPEYDDFFTNPMDRDRDDDDDPGEKSMKRGSAFKRRAEKDEDEEEEDGGGRKAVTRRRSSSSRSKPASRESEGTQLRGFGGSKKKTSDSSAEKTTVRRRRTR